MSAERDFDFLEGHVAHLVVHPYDDAYLYDPVCHFIVDRNVAADHFEQIDHNGHALLAAARLELGVEQRVE